MGHYVVKGDVSLSEYVTQLGTFEFDSNVRDLRTVAGYIPDGGVVVEAGACLGDHTGMYSRIVGALGRVYAFEPHPASYTALVANTARLSNVRTFRLGLGAGIGSTVLSMTTNLGASYLGDGPHDFAGEPPVAWPLSPVTVTTLDDALGALEQFDFFHLDAEGSELAILQGASRLIQRFRPAMLVEVTDTWLKRYGHSEAMLIAHLMDLRYDLVRLQPNPTQYNLLATPR